MATSAAAWYGLVTAREEGQSIAPDIAYDRCFKLNALFDTVVAILCLVTFA